MKLFSLDKLKRNLNHKKDFHVMLIDIEDACKGFLRNECIELQKRERLEQYVIKVTDNESVRSMTNVGGQTNEIPTIDLLLFCIDHHVSYWVYSGRCITGL